MLFTNAKMESPCVIFLKVKDKSHFICKFYILLFCISQLCGCAVTLGFRYPNYCSKRLCIPCITFPFAFDEMSEIGFGIGYDRGCSRSYLPFYFIEDQFQYTLNDKP